MTSLHRKHNRIVIIGIDGIPYRLMDEFSAQEIMPNFKDLKNAGFFCEMRSSIPEISSTAWSSIITGQNPGKHGIFGFTDLLPNTYSLRFPNFRDLKSNPFWEKYSDKKSIILNVPSSYPPRKMNGIHIAGFVAPDLNKAVYPPDLLPLLEEYDYRVDVDAGKAQKSFDLFLNDLFKTLESRIRIFELMWDKLRWDIFMPVFTSSDRLAHFLWDAYENPEHTYFETFRHFFHELDKGIGMITQKIGSADELIILSDHGMEKTKVEVNLNSFLKERGFLNLGSNCNKRYRNIMEGSRAFVLDPARIYLNKKGKYPRGSVSPSKEEQILDELVNEFLGLSWEGKRVIEKIYRRDEIYHGKQVQNGPDLVLIPKSGFHLRGKIDRQSIFESPIIAGKHTLNDAFLFVHSHKSSIRVPSHPNVEHIVPLIEDLCLI